MQQNGTFIDYYELLMIGPNADLKMLEAAVRLMLARYNPNNTETGDQETFEAVKRAYLTLSDANHRAAYDKKRQQQDQQEALAEGVPVDPEQIRAERRKREGVVRVLYSRIAQYPTDPGVSTPQIADALDLEHDELQFAYWVLRERGLIARTENGNFAMTVEGVAWMENKVSPDPSEASLSVRPPPKPVETAPSIAPKKPSVAALATAVGRR